MQGPDRRAFFMQAARIPIRAGLDKKKTPNSDELGVWVWWSWGNWSRAWRGLVEVSC